ncbi:MAG: hypothetical protein GY869_02890 [Planctomycetes bacterium]|nr:hypothetical protein [Planctomycetota bacterium]
MVGFVLWGLILSGVGSGAEAEVNRHPVVVGYYPYYAPSRLAISSIQYGALTDINYFGMKVYANGDLDSSNIRFGDQALLVSLAHGQGVRVSISVIGFDAVFGQMAASAAARANFISNITQYCLTYNLDGVDLDWELAFSAEAKDNYSLLVQELSASLKPLGLLLTVAVYPLGSDIRAWAIEYVDWLNIMVYNFAWPHSTYANAVQSLDHWEAYGCPREKEVLGIPFYGKDDTSSYSYKYIMDNYNPDPNVDIVDGIGFNGIDTVRQKTDLAVSGGYGGVMIWELAHDTQDGRSLLTAIDAEVDEVLLESFTKAMLPPSGLTATASSTHNYYGGGVDSPQLAVNGSGMISAEGHAYSYGSWISATPDDVNGWFVVDLGVTERMHSMKIWNLNEGWSWNVYGFKQTQVYVSTAATPGNPVNNPLSWQLVSSPILTKGPGVSGYATPDIIDMAAHPARHVGLVVQSTHRASWAAHHAGLSEVQFFRVGLRGDLDLDQDVDLFDLNILLDNYLATGNNIAGDLNFDGIVNIIDLNKFAQEWLLGSN